MCGGTRKPEVDMILIEKATIDSRAIGIEATGDSLRATHYQYLRLGDRVLADVEGLGHILRDRARKDKAIGMTR